MRRVVLLLIVEAMTVLTGSVVATSVKPTGGGYGVGSNGEYPGQHHDGTGANFLVLAVEEFSVEEESDG